MDPDAQGVVVTDVASGSKAAEAGIRQGDVVIEINRQPIASLEDYRDQLRRIDDGDTVQMLLRRGGGGLVAVKFTR
jgi:serine protease Do